MVIFLCAWFRIQHYNHPHYYHYHPLAFADMLAIGGILAWIVNYKSSWIDRFKGVAKPITIIPYLLAVLLIISRKWIYSQGEWAALIVSLEPILVSIIFSLMIAEQNYATHSAIKFEKFKFLKIKFLKILSTILQKIQEIYNLHIVQFKLGGKILKFLRGSL
jgi:hypothetical protein